MEWFLKAAGQGENIWVVNTLQKKNSQIVQPLSVNSLCVLGHSSSLAIIIMHQI